MALLWKYESITNYTGTSKASHELAHVPPLPTEKKVSADTEPSSHSGSHARRGVDDGGSARQKRRVDEVTEQDSLIECII